MQRLVTGKKAWAGHTLVWACVGALFSACSGSERPRTRTERPPSSLAQNNDAFERRDVRDAPTELLQKSVARVLGFTDMGTMPLTIYQDTQSALYESLASQEARPDGVVPDPIFYHSPVFAADVPKLLLLPDGYVNVTIDNAFTQQSVRQVIGDKMAEVLRLYKIAVERIGILPMENITAKVTAFGRDYTVSAIDSQFRTMVFKIPQQDIPESVLSTLRTSSSGGQASQQFLANLSLITIGFDYYVQQYGQSECRLNVSDNDVSNVFMDQAGCPEEPSPETMSAAIATIAQKRGQSAAQSTQAKLDTLLNKGRTVTACLAGKEASKLRGAASVSCTKGGTRPEDQKSDTQYPKIITDFLKTVIKPELAIELKQADTPSQWDSQVTAAVIRMFGDPERFASVVNKINSEINRNETTQKDDDYYDQLGKWLYTYNNHDLFTDDDSFKDNTRRTIDSRNSEKGKSSSKGGGGGFGLNVAGFGGSIGGSSSRSSGNYDKDENLKDEFRANVERFHKMMQEVKTAQVSDREEKIKSVSNFLFENGVDVGIEEINGEWKVFPRLNIAVSTNVDRSDSEAQSYQTNDLGYIVRESDNVTVELKKTPAPQLVIKLQCSADAPAFTTVTRDLTQFEWWASQAFWAALSKDLSTRVAAANCSFIGVKMFYRQAEQKPSMLPDVVDLTVSALVQAMAVTTPPAPLEKALPVAIELRRENTEATPVEGAISINAPGKQVQELTVFR
jgi:hypothetical protein